jgi:hypothetical protein
VVVEGEVTGGGRVVSGGDEVVDAIPVVEVSAPPSSQAEATVSTATTTTTHRRIPASDYRSGHSGTAGLPDRKPPMPQPSEKERNGIVADRCSSLDSGTVTAWKDPGGEA